MSDTAHDDEPTDFPILGEPLPVELANTRYRDGEAVVDFLATPVMTAGWFEASPTARSFPTPRSWTEHERVELATLRDAVDDVLRAAIAGRMPEPASLAAVNAAARRVSVRAELDWTRSSGPRRVDRRDAATVLDSVLGAIADDAITLVGGPDASMLRICANGDCEMLFVKHHHRRRWCHDSCGHRHRQAAYVHRRRSTLRA